MNDKTNDDKTLGVNTKKTLTLKRSGVEQSTVRQNFSHGRTKAVVVETKKRKFARPDEKPEAEAAPAPTPVVQPVAPEASSPVSQPAAPAPAAPAPAPDAPAAATPAPTPVAPAPAPTAAPVASSPTTPPPAKPQSASTRVTPRPHV